MQVGPVHVAADRSFVPIRTVVPKTGDHGPQGPRARPEPRTASVILKPDQSPSAKPRAANDDVADQAPGLRAGMFRRQVEEPESNQLLTLGGSIVVAEELVAAADGQHDRAATRGIQEGLTLPLPEVSRRQMLLAVLPAAHEIEVMCTRDRRRAQPGLLDAHVDAPPLGPVHQGHEVPAISVQVKEVGAEVADSEFHVGIKYTIQ